MALVTGSAGSMEQQSSITTGQKENQITRGTVIGVVKWSTLLSGGTRLRALEGKHMSVRNVSVYIIETFHLLQEH